MDTVESRTEEHPLAETVYDGFISYSHAADDLLAPRLQAGLQRFAKPWWKRRALRIFRDESSLSANPHLWSSITDALDESAWFVLLLSPEAADSPWVNDEVGYWLEDNDSDRIIPVLTDGEFGWSDGEVAGDAFPPAIVGAFSDEPRWVDLRFARTEEQLDLQNPEFAAAIADIASPIRGVPKDELASEEVRQHRRTVRTAWAAGVVVLALALAAVGAAVVANGQRIEADEQRATAEEEKSRADTEAARANEEADRATAAATEATQNAAIARSRELAAESGRSIGDDPELATLLAMESIRALPPGAEVSSVGVLALRDAMAVNPVVDRFDGFVWSAMARDGTTAYYSHAPERAVVAVDLATGSELWRYHDPTTIDLFEHVSLSDDRALVSVSILDQPFVEDDTVPVDENGADEHPARVVVFGANDGEVVAILTPGSCPVTTTWPHGFSPDGRWLAVRTGGADCATNPDSDWSVVYDTTTWEESYRFQIEGASFEDPSFSADSSRVLISGSGADAELRSFPDLMLINTLPVESWGTLSPDGSQVALVAQPASEDQDLRPQLVEADTGRLIAHLNEANDFLRGSGLVFSGDGSRIGVVTRAKNFVFRSDNGRLVADLGLFDAVTLSLTHDGATALGGTVGSLVLFDLSGDDAGSGSAAQLPDDRTGWFNSNIGIPGALLAANAITWRGSDPFIDPAVVTFDRESRATIDFIPGSGVQLPNGRFLIMQSSLGVEDGVIGPLVLWDPSTGSTDVIEDCVATKSELAPGGAIDCDGPLFGWLSNFPNLNLAATVQPLLASIDGTYVVGQAHAFGSERTVRAWDSETLEVTSEFVIPADVAVLAAASGMVVAGHGHTGHLTIYDVGSGTVVDKLSGELPFNLNTVTFSPDGSMLYAANVNSHMFVFDTTTWESVADWEAHEAFMQGIAISADGTLLATTGQDNFVKVWGIGSIGDDGTHLLLDRVPAERPSDAIWLDNETLAVFLAPNARLVVVPLSVEALLETAQERATRGFSPGECATYGIDPCPTLEDIQSR